MLYRYTNDRSAADPFFLTPWDASHWMDLVMVEMREKNVFSVFLKRLIKRSNRLHTMFPEIVDIAASARKIVA